MFEAAHERHNRLAPELAAAILRETQSEPEAYVLLESIIYGVLTFFRDKDDGTTMFLDAITENVRARIAARAERNRK